MSLLYERLFDIISDIPIMKDIHIEFIIHEVALHPTNVGIDDDERKMNPLANSTNEHNSYKKDT